jgi:L-iditol 2-dehydrogenase
MRVAMYYNNKDIRLEEVPTPTISENEMLLKVHASGICGSDVMEWYRIDKAPLVLGHEIGAEVVEVGTNVTQYKVGDRVCASHHVPCNQCRYCQRGDHTVCETIRRTNFDPGGFAEFVRLPAINVNHGVYALPEKVKYEDATFTEPLACVLRGQRRAGGIKKGDAVLVLGCGIAGLLHIKLAKAMGASLIAATDVNQYRLTAARKFGADLTIDAKRFKPSFLGDYNERRMADMVIVATGAIPAFEQGLASVEQGGTLLLFAPTKDDVDIPLPVNKYFWRGDRNITTSYAASPDDHLEALELVSSGKVTVKDMVTHRFGLEETIKGFQLVAEAGDSIKVMIHPQR